MTDEAPEPAAEPLAPAQRVTEQVLRQRFGALLQGAARDVEKYAAEMSVDLTFAAATNDDRALRHLAAQARFLGEANRLRGSRAVWGTLSEFIFDLGAVLAVGLRTAL